MLKKLAFVSTFCVIYYVMKTQKDMKKVTIKKGKVDGITTLSAYVNGQFVESVETSSQFSVSQATAYLKGKYN